MAKAKWISIGLIFASLVALSLTQRNRYDDKRDLPPGPYCADAGCCPGRQDQCSAPILGTLCYCDDFCNQTRVEDCCPDFWSHCKGIPPPEPPPTTTVEPPPETRACTYKGVNYRYGDTVKKNCNLCKCEQIGNTVEFLCERNVCLIDPLIVDTVNRERRYTWTASNYTKFWGKTLDQGIATRLGTVQPEAFLMRMNPMKRIYNPNDLPRQFDSLREWPTYITAIQEQGDCAASWAISAAAVASDRFAIVSKGLETVQLSAQNLISCDRRGQQSCKGGHLDKAWRFMGSNGLVDEDCFPYLGYDERCRIDLFGDLRSSGCRLPANSYRTKKYMVGPAYRLGNETDIMLEIMKSGPVQATMLVRNDFFTYSGGIYEHSDVFDIPKSGFLSVRIVGWGEEFTDNGLKKYWKVANSWGEDWGEDGYFRIVRGVDESEIESFVIAAWPEIETRRYPSRPMPEEPDLYSNRI
ncbi:hypothetical protein WA026_017866 [Henosepilachna vigintioctopunctata]|uniref:SMB domain-containing protein n=1 Tax=Henosepilachna vigintioctopunctata TaxID=420089 RepID=A0AAW1TVR0_9CUCU